MGNMDDVEYAQLKHKKRHGKPQQTRPHLEEPSTIVYADIRTSHIQLPVEDTKPTTENTQRKSIRIITKIITALIILTLSCAVSVWVYKSITERATNCLNSTGTNSGFIVCPDDWLRHRENCYYFSSGREYRTWNESQEVCERMGAHLLVIEDPEQQKFIKRFSRLQAGQAKELFWIGLYRDGDGWRWVDGRLYNTSQFQITGESTDSCVQIHATAGYNKDRCQSKHNWICQKRVLKIWQIPPNIQTLCLIHNTNNTRR